MGMCLYGLVVMPRLDGDGRWMKLVNGFVTITTASKSRFEEGVAMEVTRALAETIGERYVSTMGEEYAARYLLSKCMELKEYADKHRPDLEVVVAREQVIGGIGRQEAFGLEIANVYNNLTNVVLKVSPKGSRGRKAVLINGHYDSTLGSPGASDCASCVGIGYAIARTIIHHQDEEISSPVVFLFNGGEETLMQASHGFMASSMFSKDVGAFINIESTGNWGPDVIFQHTDDWTLKAFSKVAPYPRGNSMAQDFFELGLIPADTDYRMFSYRHHGYVPGVDLAFVFDGIAYHTKQDVVDRIRPGTIQSMGENVLEAVKEFTRVLGLPGYKESTYADRATVQSRGQVFFDIVGRYMIVYDFRIATVLHNIPLLAFLSLSLLAGHSETIYGDQYIADPLTMLKCTSKILISFLSAMIAPAIVGVCRSFITQKPISWYGNFLEACLIYIPAGVAGLLYPFSKEDEPAYKKLVAGSGLFFSLLSSLMVLFGMNSSYLPASWGFGALFVSVMSLIADIYLWGLLGMILPCYLNCSVSITTLMHVTEKIGLTGSLPGPLGIILTDCIVGILAGYSVAILFGCMTPYLVSAFRNRRKSLCIALMVFSVTLAYISSFWEVSLYNFSVRPMAEPYSEHAPKRMIFQHIHRIKDNKVEDVYFSACSLDAIPVDEQRMLPPNLRSLPSRSFHSSDWVAFYPLNYLVSGITKQDVLNANETSWEVEMESFWPSLPRLKQVSTFGSALHNAREALLHGYQLVRSAVVNQGTHNKSGDPFNRIQRKYFELDTALPGWAVLNITGQVRGWSVGKDGIARVKGYPDQHIVRYASGPYTTKWKFWLDVSSENPSINIDVFVKHMKISPRARMLLQGIPEWISSVSLTAWQESYNF